MINITIYAYINSKWVEQQNFTRPVSGAKKLDETLDSAVIDFTLQSENTQPPFTKYKIVASDGTTTMTEYFVIGSCEEKKVRMSG